MRKGERGLAKLCILGVCLLGVSISAGSTAEKSAPEISSDAVYKIPSQPLDPALKAFAAISGMQVLFETALTAGRRSAPVTGVFTADAALRTLLAGSGLIGIRTDVDAFSIAMPKVQQSDEAIEPDARFLGALQTGILESLCRTAVTAPGTYRVALQLWVTSTGAVRRAQLLGTSGEPRRDQAIAVALRDVSVSVPAFRACAATDYTCYRAAPAVDWR